jgi:hypothetical protein
MKGLPPTPAARYGYTTGSLPEGAPQGFVEQLGPQVEQHETHEHFEDPQVGEVSNPEHGPDELPGQRPKHHHPGQSSRHTPFSQVAGPYRRWLRDVVDEVGGADGGTGKPRKLT